jgi:4'-phosphopantetheinyl transferase
MSATAHENPNPSARLQLWFAHPSDLSESDVSEACIAILDEAERARAVRFKFDRHRREYIATHALTRAALSHAHPSPPQSWSFICNKHGKPSPVSECGLRFNQSNSLELTVCLVALPDPISGGPAEVGVDVESFARSAEIVPLASRVFSPAERAELEALPTGQRPDRALSLWTFKEAYIKARGMGLSLPLQKISFLFDEPKTDGQQTIRFAVEPEVDDDPTRWRFCQFNHAGHRVALAVEAAAVCNPEIYEARPPLAPPTRLKLGSPIWFSHQTED